MSGLLQYPSVTSLAFYSFSNIHIQFINILISKIDIIFATSLDIVDSWDKLPITPELYRTFDDPQEKIQFKALRKQNFRSQKF